MDFSQAINKVGKAMGETKYHSAMGGSMLPTGNLDAPAAIGLIYDVDAHTVAGYLHEVMDKEYKRISNKAWKKAGKKK